MRNPKPQNNQNHQRDIANKKEPKILMALCLLCFMNSFGFELI